MPDQSLTMAEALSDEPDLSTFENKSGLAEDMKFLASMPELCDVTFLVGDTREPVCAVKAVLAARSRSVIANSIHLSIIYKNTDLTFKNICFSAIFVAS
jgi:hypothetical protein